VSEKIDLLRRMLGERRRIRFSELFAESTSRSEVVVTFLAILELIRLRWIAAEQPAAFAEIDICRIDGLTGDAEGAAATVGGTPPI
jgi:segregation and condensation protein A